MVLSCCVVNCRSRGQRDQVNFYRIPGELHHKHRTDLNELSRQRRRKWLNAIKRQELAEKKYSVICSKHFITGKPADLTDTLHPDWIPSVNIFHKIASVTLSESEKMEIIVPVAKRIKLEHSYAYLAEFQPVTVKEEDPLKLAEESDVVGTIKIEVDETNLIKTEPVDEIEGEGSGFEYLNVPNEVEHEIPPEQLPFDSLDKPQQTQIVEPKIESETPADNPVDDPLHIVIFNPSFEYVPPEKPEPSEKKSSKKISSKAADNESIPLQRLQKERDSLQKTVKKLRADLKETKAREKALQMELGARRMSELSLEEDNKVLNVRLQENKKKEEANEKQISQLTLKLSLAEKENLVRNDMSERVRRDLATKLETVKAQLKKKDSEHRNLDLKCSMISHNFTALSAKFTPQKAELELVKRKLQAIEKNQATTSQIAQSSKQRITELNKELALLRQTNEELQKSLLTEKKMSRFFIKERDQLLEEQEAKFQEADRELLKLKQSVGSLTGALKQKIVECKAQREATKLVMVNYQKKGLELKTKMQEVEKKQEELSKKQCEYCGF